MSLSSYRGGAVYYRDPFSTDAGVESPPQKLVNWDKRFLCVKKKKEVLNDKEMENRTECDAGQLRYAMHKRFPMCK